MVLAGDLSQLWCCAVKQETLNRHNLNKLEGLVSEGFLKSQMAWRLSAGSIHGALYTKLVEWRTAASQGSICVKIPLYRHHLFQDNCQNLFFVQTKSRGITKGMRSRSLGFDFPAKNRPPGSLARLSLCAVHPNNEEG